MFRWRGVRDYGTGRAAYVGLLASNIFARPVFNDEGRKTYETYMSKGWEGHPSGLLTFYANVIAWISANAAKLESADWKSWPSPADSATRRNLRLETPQRGHRRQDHLLHRRQLARGLRQTGEGGGARLHRLP